MRDNKRQPHFPINDQEKVRRCASQKLCGICGRRMNNGAWFVGGWRCFMDPFAAFIDPPNHQECAEYALRVCPFLASRRYSHRVNFKKLDPANLPEDRLVISLPEEEMPQAQPELFGLGQTFNLMFIPNSGKQDFFVANDWNYVEAWKRGSPTGRVPDEATSNEL
jgi:hypothetical protein